jgi:hypothetical protein
VRDIAVADLPLTSLIAQNQAPRTHVVPPRSVEYHREPDPAHQRRPPIGGRIVDLVRWGVAAAPANAAD